MYTVTRRIQFAAGHRVMDHGSKCRNIHGHNYVAFITAAAATLDRLGMVIDFSTLKDKVGQWIDYNWDHGFIVYEQDERVIKVLEEFSAMESGVYSSGFTNGFMQKIYKLPANPTAENMAQHLIEVGNRLLEGSGVRIVKVALQETENCFAEVVDPITSTWDPTKRGEDLFLGNPL